jgi:hypothetical protein
VPDILYMPLVSPLNRSPATRRRRLMVAAGVGAMLVSGTAPDRAGACPKCRLGASALTGSQPGESPWFDEFGAVRGDAWAGDEHGGDVHDGGDPSGDGAGPRDGPAAKESHHGPLHPFQLTGGVNVTTAYYHRGYLQENQGVIVQPHLTLAYTAYERGGPDGFSLTPYVSWWNSLHDARTFTDGDRDLWYESELMAGVVVANGPASLDLKYTLYSYPNGALSQIQELGAKASYDFASLWRDASQPSNFVLLGWVAVEKELSDQNEPPVPSDGLSGFSAGGGSAVAAAGRDGAAGRRNRPAVSAPGSRAPRVAQLNASHAPIFHQPTAPSGGSGAEEGFDTSTQGTYVELGLEPSFRVRAGDTPVGLSFPVVLGLGAGDYYQEAGGDNDPLGYVQAGVQATVPLPMPGDGKWYLSASVSYLHLFADSLQFANYGGEDEVIGTVGLSFAY